MAETMEIKIFRYRPEIEKEPRSSISRRLGSAGCHKLYQG